MGISVKAKKKPPSINKEKEVKDYLEELASKTVGQDIKILDRRAALAASRDYIFNKELKYSLKEVFKPRWIKPPIYKGKKAKVYDRMVNILLTDLHFHSLLDPREVPIKYGPQEEARRFGCVAAQVADYKRQHRSSTILNIIIAGDVIEGILHDMRAAAPLALQIAAAIRHLTNFILFEAGEFSIVNVFTTPGNHDRNKQRHPDRAIFQKWDGHAYTIYDSVKWAIQQSQVKNVKFHSTLKPYTIVPLLGGKKAFATHGDTLLKVKHPSKSVNTQQILHKILKWNTANTIKGPFDVFMVGHHHHPVIMPSYPALIINGALVPSNEFSLSLDEPQHSCGQVLFESTSTHPIGDFRFICVDDADKQKQFESIITPFKV